MSRNNLKHEPRKNYRLNQHELREVKRITKQISAKMRRMSSEIYPESNINPCRRRLKLFYFRLCSHFRFIFRLIGFLFGIWTWVVKNLSELLPNRRPKRGMGGSKLKTL